MAYIHLIRHGQASSREQDYDKLTDRGYEQAELLAKHYLNSRMQIDYIATGSLLRHKETAQEFRRIFSLAGKKAPEPVEFPDLDEFDTKTWSTLVREIAAEDEDFFKLKERWKQIRSTSERKASFIFAKMTMRMLETWISGNYKTTEIPTFADFAARAPSVLDKLPNKKEDANLLVFTSGTPIALLICHVLGMEPIKAGNFMRWLYNSSYTTLYKNRARFELVSMNEVPHLPNLWARTFV